MIMLLLFKVMLLILSVESCDIKWKGLGTTPVEVGDIFKERIPIHWERLLGRKNCVEKIKVDQKKNGTILETTDIYQRELKEMECLVVVVLQHTQSRLK